MMNPIRDTIANDCQALGDEEKQQQAEYAVIAVSLKNLSEYPFVKKAMDEGRLSLHGWHYRIESGSLYSVDPETQKATLLTQ